MDDPRSSILSSFMISATPDGVQVEFYWLLIPIFILTILSGLFSASETAYSSVSKIRLRTMHAEGNKRAGKTLALLERYDNLLSTVLIGNNIVNIVIATLATVMFMQMLSVGDALANVISTIVTTVVLLIFGEITPKTVARNNPEKYAMRFYPFLIVCYYILYSINFLFKGWKLLLIKVFKLSKGKSFTEEELVTIVETAESEGELDSHESQLIKNAIEFDDLEIKDIMVPRVNITAIEDTCSLNEIADIFRESGYSRLPIYHESLDNMRGILNEKDFNTAMYQGHKSLSRMISPIITVALTMKISVVLRMLQRARQHMAIVVDEFGGTAGLVTLEDIIEELVGEIWDEHDEVEELYKQISDDEYLVKGFSNASDVLEKLNVDTREEFDAVTIGGWVIEEIGTIPKVGAKFEFENIIVTVMKANAKRVLEVKIKVLPKVEEEEDE